MSAEERLGNANERHEGRPLDNQESGAEKPIEPTARKVIEALEKAPTKSIVLVSGLSEEQYQERIKLLAAEKNITVLDRAEIRNNTQFFEADIERSIVADASEMLKKMLETSLPDGDKRPSDEMINALTKPSENPAEALRDWLAIEYGEEDSGSTPSSCIARVMEQLRVLAQRLPVSLVLPGNSPLALAIFAYVRGDGVTHSTIAGVIEREYPIGGYATGMVTFEQGRPPALSFG